MREKVRFAHDGIWKAVQEMEQSPPNLSAIGSFLRSAGQNLARVLENKGAIRLPATREELEVVYTIIYRLVYALDQADYDIPSIRSFAQDAGKRLSRLLTNTSEWMSGMGAMELQFVGDIKAVRVGDKFKAFGKLQSRRTGNYIEVSTEIDIPALMAEARSVYNAARAYLSAQGKDIEALPSGDTSMEGMGSAASIAKNIFDPLHVFHKEGGGGGSSKKDKKYTNLQQQMLQLRQQQQTQLSKLKTQQQFQQMRQQSRTRLTDAQRQLADEKKKHLVEMQMRSMAEKNLAGRQAERQVFEGKLRELKDQITASNADANKQAALQAQAAQYEDQMAQMDEATLQMQSQYENQIASVQAMPAAQVAALPQVASLSAQVDAEAEADATLQGMGGVWSWVKNVAKKFKKALAVVFRSKIVKGLVKAAGTVYGGQAGGKLAEGAYGGATKMLGARWKVPGLGISVQNAQTWVRLLEAAKPPVSDARCIKVLNRVKLMARLKHPAATRTFWLLRDIERLLPEVRASVARGDANLTQDPSLSESEPGAVPSAMLGIQLLGLGATESQRPVKVRCMEFDPVVLGWEQIPFSAAMGKKKKRPNKKQIAANTARMRAAMDARRKAAQARASQNQPTAATAPSPGMMPAQQMPQQYAQPTYDPYAQGYNQYNQANYAPGAIPIDPYAAAYAGTPDPYTDAYAANPQSYGDYSAAQSQPGFDPYNPASYGYNPDAFQAAMGAVLARRPGVARPAAVSAAARIAALRARQRQMRNQPTASTTAPYDPYYGQPSGSQAGYPPGYGPYDPYGQGYDPYASADPYAAAYAATPPNYDPYAATYAAQAQAYGDYSQAQNQPGFDPYSAASYGY